MVRITRVHTGAGDGGETSLLTGERVPKSMVRVELFGTIDELNSSIGWARMELSRLPKEAADGGVRATAIRLESDLEPGLALIQQELFDVGGECAGNPDNLPVEMVLIEMKHANRLVSEMDSWTENTPPLDSFILPAGSPVIVALHVARTVARRAERCAVRLVQIEGEGSVRPVVLAYLNRLSDWLFVACRHSSFTLGEEEILWEPLSSREN
ncbi:MAG TPA: cob(I)yrinic acid a,c-diamide adenosyltransferase [Candidatus Thalassarchaeaceae archaeon]|nr:cob(I)yrinic acid a,c-diamide adenosyltransferase [Candidatus Thalassarchaeaceae archaeon]